jgi:hypothetical protein
VNPKQTAIAIGGVLGAVLGVAAAWTYMRQQEAKAEMAGIRMPNTIEAGPGDFIKIAISLFALLRLFDDLFKPK